MARCVKDLREIIKDIRIQTPVNGCVTDSDDDDWDASAAELLYRPDTALSARPPVLSPPPQQSPRLRSQAPPPQASASSLPRHSSKPSSGVRRAPTSGGKKLLPPVADLEDLLPMIDTEFVYDLLGRANTQLAGLTDWCLQDDHFVDLAHFWLTDFPEEKKRQLLGLEHSCLLDQVSFAFRRAAAAGRVSTGDVGRLLSAVFKEFPDRLLSARGAHMFLDHLDALTAGRSHAECRRLLTDVKLTSSVRQHAEWLLALRSFAICSVWTAVVTFYRSLVDRGDVRPPRTEVPGFGDQLEGRVVRCIQQGYVEVLHYFCLSKKLDPRAFQDGQQRNLIFLSVTCAQKSKENAPQMRTLRYLLKRLQPDPPVNATSDTGNSALHLAASAGNLELAEMLVRHGHANVNLPNTLCDSCTPLHLAVMYGHTQLVSYLLDSGADLNLRMGGRTALELAEESGDTRIHELLLARGAGKP